MQYNDVPGSDEEMELGLGSDASLASSCGMGSSTLSLPSPNLASAIPASASTTLPKPHLSGPHLGVGLHCLCVTAVQRKGSSAHSVAVIDETQVM